MSVFDCRCGVEGTTEKGRTKRLKQCGANGSWPRCIPLQFWNTWVPLSCVVPLVFIAWTGLNVELNLKTRVLALLGHMHGIRDIWSAHNVVIRVICTSAGAIELT